MNARPGLRRIHRDLRFFSLGAALLTLPTCASNPTPTPESVAAKAAAGRAAAALAAPPVELRPAAESRASLLASISIPSIDRLLGSGTALVGRAVPLPLDATSVRDMLLSQAGLVPAVGENLDFASPAGVAVVAMGPGIDAGVVMAVPAKSPEQAEKVIAALGKTLSRRGDVAEVSNGAGGKGWIWRSANVLVLSDSLDALVKGARLALEARRPSAEDVTAVLFPDAIAAANGTDVKSALAKSLAMMRAAQAAQGVAMTGDSLAMIGDLLNLFGDTTTLEIGLAVDTTQGVSLRVRMNAKPGSSLEAVARQNHPVEFDPLLFAGGKQPAFLFGYSVGPITKAHLVRIRHRLQTSSEAGSPAAQAFFDALVDASQGMGFASMHLKPELGVRTSYPLKDAASGAKLSALLKKLDRVAALALIKTQMEGATVPFDWSVKKETVGKLPALHYTMSPAKHATPAVRDGFQKLFGKQLDMYTAFSGARLLGTAGKQAKADLTALANAKSAPPTGDVAQAISAAKGKDLIEYVDFGPFVATMAAMSTDPRAAFLSKGTQAPIPLTFTEGGDGTGKIVTLELNIPPAAFSGVGTLLQGLNSAGATKP
ncbi:MAG TPA: hypothetical protein VNO55_03490 [Polyangia bacterium]|nr:hypothetical protein [Polyangia bacterium]